MIKRIFTSVLICLAFVSCNIRHENIPTNDTEHTVSINGLVIHYGVYGPQDGKPVILLHGNGGSHHDLDSLSSRLAREGYRVYGMDSRGQGANDPLKEYHYADMAEDVYQFCLSLKIDKPFIYGWSDGGIIAIETELAHHGTACAMALSGANISVDGTDEEAMAGIPFDPEDPLVIMMMNEPDIDPAELAAITCPVLVLAGENDLILEQHTRLIAESLPNSQLQILEGEDHVSYVWNSPKIGDILMEYFHFLNY